MGSPIESTREERLQLLARVPRPRPGVDLQGLALDTRDAFVLSRIDGHTSAALLGDLVGLPEADLLKVLARLQALGAISFAQSAGGPRPSAAPLEAGTDDLNEEERQRILAAEELIGKTHWEVLGVSGSPSAAEVKQAYFGLSKTFHPDRYFGRKLGQYRERLNRVFGAIKAAYDTLSDEAARAEYARWHPPPAAASVQRGSLTDEQLEARRREIIAARRQKQRRRPQQPASPEKAREMRAAGMAQLARGDAVAAASSFKLAIAYDPNNAEYPQLYEEAQAEATLLRARRIAEQAEQQAEAGEAARAAVGFVQAFELAPGKGNYAIRAAEEYLKAGELEQASRVADKAVALSPRRKEARLVAAEVLLAQGDVAGATAQVAELTAFDRKDPRVNKLLHRLAKNAR